MNGCSLPIQWPGDGRVTIRTQRKEYEFLVFLLRAAKKGADGKVKEEAKVVCACMCAGDE